jgi:hypothetical protein
MELAMEPNRSRPSWLGRLPARFERRVLVLAPGQAWPYSTDEWRGALVVVERGRIELVALDGIHHRFPRGAVLWLESLPLRALRNPGRVPAVLVAIARRGAGTGR